MSRNRWLEAIDDQQLLNTLLEADPALCFNMAEMGFIIKLPFQLDHNGATVAAWVLTAQGRREIMERFITVEGNRKDRSSVH